MQGLEVRVSAKVGLATPTELIHDDLEVLFETGLHMAYLDNFRELHFRQGLRATAAHEQ